MKYNLIKTEDVEKLNTNEIRAMYGDFINPGMLKYMDLTGFSKVRPVKSEGMYIYTKGGKKILDFTCGVGVLGHGHNHPRIIEVRKKFEDDRIPIIWKAFPSPYLAALSKNLAEISPGDLNYSFICNSGAEAIEGAMKVAEKFQGKHKDKIISANNSFHGKTHAALSVSGLEDDKKYFKLLDGILFVPYDNYEALEKLILSRCKEGTKENDVCCVILESMHCNNVWVPQKGYLKRVRKLTEDYGILLIMDEVYSGFGKTGKMFAFEHEGIIPDMFAVSKNLGGGKATVAAYVVRDSVFKKAYGSMQDSMIHTSTYNGFAQECITAVESINILCEENLMENAIVMGDYLLSSLLKLKEKYPHIIKEVRGSGVICGVEFYPYMPKIAGPLKKLSPFLKNLIDKFVGGAIMNELFFKYNIFTHINMHYGNFLHVEPPLIVKKEEIDQIINAIDSILSKGLSRLAFNLVRRTLSIK